MARGPYGLGNQSLAGPSSLEPVSFLTRPAVLQHTPSSAGEPAEWRDLFRWKQSMTLNVQNIIQVDDGHLGTPMMELPGPHFLEARELTLQRSPTPRGAAGLCQASRGPTGARAEEEEPG